MTDRELLELAAKAAGLSLEQGPGSPPEKCFGACWDGYTWDYWNPLDDDGDALRLAAKLKIDVKHYDDHVVGWFDGGCIGTGRIPYEDNPYAATRRAIVRAAAEIGRSKE